MDFNEFKYLGTTGLRKREIGNREVTKEYYINHLLSVKIVNKYTLICVNELELMEYTRRGSEFDSTIERLRSWYENDYDINLNNFIFAFPLLHELAYFGDEEARNIYYKLINNKSILEKLIDVDFNDFFKDIYEIYLELLDMVEIDIDLAKRIKLDDLRIFYLYQYQADRMENDFYQYIWNIVKNKLNIPISMINEAIIKELFNTFNVQLPSISELNYEVYLDQYYSRYNKVFFREIIDPILTEILTNRPNLKTQFILEFNRRINIHEENLPAEMVLLDCILKCSELSEEILEYNTCGELILHENTSLNEDNKYLLMPEFVHLIINTANKIKKMREVNSWILKSKSEDYLDYSFLVIIQKVLLYIQKNRLIEKEKLMKILITCIEEMKKKTKK